MCRAKVCHGFWKGNKHKNKGFFTAGCIKGETANQKGERVSVAPLELGAPAHLCMITARATWKCCIPQSQTTLQIQLSVPNTNWAQFFPRAQRLQDLKLPTFTFRPRASVTSRACGRKGMCSHHLLGQEHQIRFVFNYPTNYKELCSYY